MGSRERKANYVGPAANVGENPCCPPLSEVRMKMQLLAIPRVFFVVVPKCDSSLHFSYNHAVKVG